jgi:hypothetical protein
VADLPDAVTPLNQIWHQDLRSAFPLRPFRIRLREYQVMEGIDYARNICQGCCEVRMKPDFPVLKSTLFTATSSSRRSAAVDSYQEYRS